MLRLNLDHGICPRICSRLADADQPLCASRAACRIGGRSGGKPEGAAGFGGRDERFVRAPRRVVVTAFGRALGLDEQSVAQAGAVLMVAFGLMLLVPRFGMVLSGATAGMSARADAQMNTLDQGSLRGQFAGGLLLGAVWSPCIGPTLGGAIALASQGESLGLATLIMVAFALGVSTLIIGLGYGTRAWLMRNRARMQKIAVAARPIMGAVFVAVGLALFLQSSSHGRCVALGCSARLACRLFCIYLTLRRTKMNRRSFVPHGPCRPRHTQPRAGRTDGLHRRAGQDSISPRAKSMFLDFKADWCGTCKAQERVLNKPLKAANPDYEAKVTFH